LDGFGVQTTCSGEEGAAPAHPEVPIVVIRIKAKAIANLGCMNRKPLLIFPPFCVYSVMKCLYKFYNKTGENSEPISTPT
jgi:hypothetical protein